MKSHKKHTEEVNLAAKIRQTLRNYAQTQLVIILVETIASWIILSSLSIQYSILLSCIAGSLSVIPFFGTVTAAIIIGFFAVFDGVQMFHNAHPIFDGLFVGIILIVLNQLIDILLTPFLIGKKSKVHPVFILLTVIAGSSMFGIVGAALAVPALLVIITILQHYTDKNHTHAS